MPGSWSDKQYDWGLLVPVVLLGLVGLLALYSASASGLPAFQSDLCLKQGVRIGGGLVLVFACLMFNYKTLDNWATGVYLLSVGLLLGVIFFGKEAGGSQRWLVLGPVTIQPSEFAKLAVVVVLAKYYARNTSLDGFTLKTLIPPIVLTLIPCVLIIKQPDMGTAILIGLIAAFVTFFVKIERRTLYWLSGALVVLFPLFWFFVFKDYQKQRILTFWDPQRDPLGAGYHIIQSKIAIGSGMVTGKGFLQGTQNALAFLPEQHTDFILSVLAEEWGFVGGVVVLLLYLMVLIWAVSIAYQCRDDFGVILATGITAIMFWQVFVNVGMVTGLMPVVGVPLPLISYGGSSVVTFMLGIGILLNISRKRLGVD